MTLRGNPIKIGCLFGSFNPIHTGHLIIAEFMVSQAGLDRVELIVSPQNPLKKTSELAPEKDRLKMVELAVAGNERLEVNDVEFTMPRPSYTIDTLRHLRDSRPHTEFHLIMGGDNLSIITEWKEWSSLLREFRSLVYVRRGYEAGAHGSDPNVTIFEAPYLDISATYIRGCVRRGHSIRYLVPEQVREYIRRYELFEPEG